MAHDFNNLLAVINGYAGLLLGNLDPGNPMHASIQQIGLAGDRAAALTRQLLAFSRKQVLQPKVLELNGVVTSTHQMLRRLIGEDVELVSLTEPGLGRIKADPGQIEQVIMNLAVNARDAMPQGGKLTIETANVDLDAGLRAGRTRRSSPGITSCWPSATPAAAWTEATMARIFEPFFTTKEQGKGTGLGLSTVYGIVRQSGGHIDVDSAPGPGDDLPIYFPLAEQAAPPPRPGTQLPARAEWKVRDGAARGRRADGAAALAGDPGDARLSGAGGDAG